MESYFHKLLNSSKDFSKKKDVISDVSSISNKDVIDRFTALEAKEAQHIPGSAWKKR